MEITLERIKTPAAYQATRQHIFASGTSLQWTIRQERERLIKAGALLKINGRTMIDEAAFDAAMLAIGREKAAA